MILVPAYGRDYKTAAAVKKDWEAGKDFQISDISSPWNGSYINKEDFDSPTVKPVDRKGSYIRYSRLEKLTFIDKWEEDE